MSSSHDDRREEVSRVQGRYQAPALRGVVVVAWLLALASVIVQEWEPAGLMAVGLIIATPLLRVVWLILRWSQEKDHRLVFAGLALLAVVGTGAVLAAVGVG
ncbi:MAG: hypothetical protein ACE5F5_03095 [Acidimicrobiia bacterium]